MNKSPRPIRLTGLDHIVLRCTRLEQTLSFYCGVLGCSLERSLEDLGLYQLRAGSALIDLVPVGSRLGGELPPDRAKPNLDHFCLRLADADWPALHTHLEEHGISCSEPARRYGADGFGLSVYLQDPEGNVIELKGPPDPESAG